MKIEKNKIPEKIINFKNWRNIIAVGVLGLNSLTSCTDAKVQDQIYNQSTNSPIVESLELTPNVEITMNPTDLPTPTEVPTQIIEPLLIPTQISEVLAINPPNFNQENINLPPGSFDLIDAHAVYALYRQQESPSMWTSDSQFIADMETYSNQLKNQGIGLQQATAEGVTHTLLVKNDQILLNFNDESGALTNMNPGSWSKDSTSTWIDIGGEPKLFIGEDNNSYIARLNQEGQVEAFLNPIGATINKLNNQWVEVQDGLPNAIWNGKEWTTNIPIRAIVGNNNPGLTMGDYSYSTYKEIINYPTQINVKDLENPNFGKLFRQNLVETTYGVWAVGKIAGFKSGEFTGADNRQYYIVEFALDVPDDNNRLIRYNLALSSDYLQYPIANLTSITQIANNIFADNVDPFSGIEDVFQYVDKDNPLMIIDGHSGLYRYDKLVSNPDIIGVQMGFLLPNVCNEKIPGKIILGDEKPNYALDILMNSSIQPNQEKLDSCFYNIYRIAIPPELIE